MAVALATCCSVKLVVEEAPNSSSLSLMPLTSEHLLPRANTAFKQLYSALQIFYCSANNTFRLQAVVQPLAAAVSQSHYWLIPKLPSQQSGLFLQHYTHQGFIFYEGKWLLTPPPLGYFSAPSGKGPLQVHNKLPQKAYQDSSASWQQVTSWPLPDQQHFITNTFWTEIARIQPFIRHSIQLYRGWNKWQFLLYSPKPVPNTKWMRINTTDNEYHVTYSIYIQSKLHT